MKDKFNENLREAKIHSKTIPPYNKNAPQNAIYKRSTGFLNAGSGGRTRTE